MAGYIGSKAVSVNTTSATITGDASIGGNVTLNDGSADVDFRVESDDETHAIFVNGGDDVVSFFTTTTVNASSGVVGPDGVSHYADGRTDISRASGQPLNLRRRTDDGIIANFYKEASGTTANVGSIATQGSRLSIGSGDTNLNFNASANSMYPISDPTAGTLSDGAIDLGAATAQFKDFYLAGNVVIGTDGKGIDFSATGDGAGTDSSELLDDYEEGTWTPVWASVTNPSYTVQIGHYTKVGRLVTFHMSFQWDGGTSIGVNIVGLPYTVKNSAENYYMSSTYNDAGVTYGTGRTNLVGYPVLNQTYLQINATGSAVAGVSPTFATSGALYVTGFYYT